MGAPANVIVGAGVAGVRAAEALRTAGHDGDVVLVSAERELPYDRPPLSKALLAGRAGADDIRIQPASFYREHRVELELGRRAVRLDAVARLVELDDGRAIRFDRLLVATGASPVRLRAPGADLEGVVLLRTLDEALELRRRLAEAERIAVVGAGLVGLEVAAVARRAGKHVVVIERATAPMARLLGAFPSVAEAIARLHREAGVELRTSATLQRFEGAGRLERVRLADGSSIEAELALVAVGVAPATGWLAGSPLAGASGIPVGPTLETRVPGVFAAGDLATIHHALFGSVRLESWAGASDQGVAAGRAMAGKPEDRIPLPSTFSEQHGRKLQIVGVPGAADSVSVEAAPDGSLLATFTRGGQLVGAFAIDRPRDLLALRRRIVAPEKPSGSPAGAA